MRLLLCVALLCAVGCASVPSATTNTMTLEEQRMGIQYWIPETFEDLWDTVDANIGMDYGFGGHIKLTDLARLGIFDYADISVLGFDSGIFDGTFEAPDLAAWKNNGAWDLSGTIGVGLGAMARLNTWEVFDLASTLLTLNYFSFDRD